MAGGAVGALLGSIFHIGATSYGVTGIPGFLITLDYTVQYAIVLLVAFAVAFILTWIVWKEDSEDLPAAEEKTFDTSTSAADAVSEDEGIVEKA